MDRRTYLFTAAAVVLLAFLLREWHVLASVVPNPTAGDVSSYLRYALHMAWDGVYSQAGNGAAVIPDAYRSPGYPVFLLAVFKLAGMDAWFSAVYQAQVIVGALTVAGTFALARQWLPRGWSLLAGGLLALWPHHIAATNAMLVEVLLSAAIVAGLLLSSFAMSRRSMPYAIAAGAVWGCAYLINPVVALFPVVLLAVFWRERLPKHGVALLLVSLLAVGGWGLRNMAQDAEGGGRGWANLVEGSWPEFHLSQVWWPWKPELLEVKEAIAAEEALIARDHAAGLQSIGVRLAADPIRYARWYATEKPYLLWEWDIRMGKGGIYTLGVNNSPLDKWPLLGPHILLWALNPALFALALLGAVVALRRGGPASAVALFFVYITAIHVLLQAEPRYAIAYRPAELLLAVGALAWIRSWAATVPSLWRMKNIRATA